MSKFYITFGQKYRLEPHPLLKGADPDGYLTIEAPDEDEARRIAFRRLGESWSMIYNRPPKAEFFPVGEIAFWEWEGESWQQKS